MKTKITFLATLFIFSISITSFSQAENFKLFNFDLGLLYAHTPSNNLNGIGLFMEPKFNITDNIATGIRLEGALSVGGDFSGDDGEVEISVSIINSLMLTGDYFFTTTNKRPFLKPL